MRDAAAVRDRGGDHGAGMGSSTASSSLQSDTGGHSLYVMAGRLNHKPVYNFGSGEVQQEERSPRTSLCKPEQAHRPSASFSEDEGPRQGHESPRDRDAVHRRQGRGVRLGDEELPARHIRSRGASSPSWPRHRQARLGRLRVARCLPRQHSVVEKVTVAVKGKRHSDPQREAADGAATRLSPGFRRSPTESTCGR